MRRRLVLVTAALSGAMGCRALRGYAEGHSTESAELSRARLDRQTLGAARFTYDDFGGINTDALQTNAFPWKVVVAALALDRTATDGAPISRASVNQALQRFGFILPTRIANWPAGPPPRALDTPLGIVTGSVQRRFPIRLKMQIGNLGCAVCHAGVTYDSIGSPRPDVWLGLPNTSLDLEAFSAAVYASLKRTISNRAELLATVRSLFPETDTLELETLRLLLLPRIERRLATIDAPAPYPNGSPGVTNGVGALKRQFRLLPADARHSEVGFTSIPELGDVLLRSTLLADGGFIPKGVERTGARTPGEITENHVTQIAGAVAFFTVPIMGNHPDRAERQIPKVRDALWYLASYRPPRFPGSRDSAQARQGQRVYATRCAACHGTYDDRLDAPSLRSFPNRVVPQGVMGTDSMRLTVLDPALLRAIRTTAYRRHVDPVRTGGYAAPRLSGLWATAPYLHNGSVPTLWHLMHPESRPRRFFVGGHRLDFALVGIAGALDATGTWRFAPDYKPWSEPVLYDTRLPGHDNAGHAREFAGLTETEIRALLEYLKAF